MESTEPLAPVPWSRKGRLLERRIECRRSHTDPDQKSGCLDVTIETVEDVSVDLRNQSIVLTRGQHSHVLPEAQFFFIKNGSGFEESYRPGSLSVVSIVSTQTDDANHRVQDQAVQSQGVLHEQPVRWYGRFFYRMLPARA